MRQGLFALEYRLSPYTCQIQKYWEILSPIYLPGGNILAPRFPNTFEPASTVGSLCRGILKRMPVDEVQQAQLAQVVSRPRGGVLYQGVLSPIVEIRGLQEMADLTNFYGRWKRCSDTFR